MNNVNIIGRHGSDPELRYTPKGIAVAEITLAVDDGWGENKTTLWIGVVIWDKAAEILAKYVQKGDQLGITGRLTQDSWEDKQTGKKQTKTKVTCEQMTLCGGRRDSGSHEPVAARNAPARASAPPPAADDGEDTDDLPF
ncbi:MAG: single-stranded DNA-binding protein [Akkermansiaceae bacterium]|nr:single-stranded DNA-binding protein [Akkermansiaceae bacterium]